MLIAINLQDPVEPNTLWVNPFGVSFTHMRRSDLVRIDHEGNVLEGGQVKLVNRAAIMIHVAGDNIALVFRNLLISSRCSA
jgi:ribulose-5-phosphate 4-epimerase/fuculose-1-phosphate aldolase